MKSLHRLLLCFVVCLAYAIGGSLAFGLAEKTVKPMAPISERCVKSTGCTFFKCFERRFPCGKDYWIVKWGMKYCAKYTDQATYNTFTPAGQAMLNFTNTCQRQFLEQQYRSVRPLRCKRFFDKAIGTQGKCYADLGNTFCTVFPQNKNQFMSTMDRNDYMNTEFITMITDTLGKCKPPIDLFSLMFM